MGHIPPVPPAPRQQRRRRRQAPPPQQRPQRPAAAPGPDLRNKLDVHITCGIRDEHLRMTRETYNVFLRIWVAAEETVVFNGDYGERGYFNLVLRGNEGGTWDVKAAAQEAGRNRPLVEIAPIEKLQNDFLRQEEAAIQAEQDALAAQAQQPPAAPPEGAPG